MQGRRRKEGMKIIFPTAVQVPHGDQSDPGLPLSESYINGQELSQPKGHLQDETESLPLLRFVQPRCRVLPSGLGPGLLSKSEVAPVCPGRGALAAPH